MNKLFIIIGLLSFTISAKCDETGTCGEGLEFTYVSDTQTLTIKYTGEGSGKMTNYEYIPETKTYTTPWYDLRNQIKIVDIQEGVTAIGAHAFRQCVNMESISIPNTVKSIGRLSFYSCVKLDDIVLPQALDSVAYGCFANCSSLQSIKMPESLPRLCEYMFYKCNKLNNIVIPEDVVTIADYAFCLCEGLESISIPSRTDSICTFAFGNCYNLSQIELKEGLKYIGMAAFEQGSYTSVYIPSTVRKICSYAFNAYNFYSVNISNLSSWCNIDFDYWSNPLVWAHKLYINNSTYNTLTIPDDVTSIGQYAFDGLRYALSFKLNSDLETIGDYAFNDCVDLEQLIIPEKVSKIGEGVISGCNKVTKISVNSNNLAYDSRDNCNAIIDSKTNELLAGCQNTVIPNNVKAIGNSAFSGCTELKSATIPDGATYIGDRAFYNCTNLATLELPNSIKSIGEMSFSNCIFDEVDIPESLDTIGLAAFEKCINLKDILIPNSVKLIDQNAFVGCSNLKSITIGENVDSISFHAFADCANLRLVYCYAEKVPGTSDNSFEGSISDATLYVPDNSLDLYKSVAPWNEFKSIQPISQTGIETIEYLDSFNSGYYTLDGKMHNSKQKGINIIRMDNGKTKKVVVK